MKEKLAIEALKQVCKVLDNQNIEYWLDMGTLLGAIRNGKIIEWDSDIDLSAWYKNYLKIASACIRLTDDGFEVHFRTRSEIAIKKNNCRISINFYTLSNNKAIIDFARQKNQIGYLIRIITHYLNLFLISSNYSKINFKSRTLTKILIKISINMHGIIRENLINGMIKEIIFSIDKRIGSNYIYSIVPKHYFLNLENIKFYGVNYKIPGETEKYLSHRYGKNWKKPKRDYVFYEDDCSINTN